MLSIVIFICVQPDRFLILVLFFYLCSFCFKQEALAREQLLENKLAVLQRLLGQTESASTDAWKSLIDEVHSTFEDNNCLHLQIKINFTPLVNAKIEEKLI